MKATFALRCHKTDNKYTCTVRRSSQGHHHWQTAMTIQVFNEQTEETCLQPNRLMMMMMMQRNHLRRLQLLLNNIQPVKQQQTDAILRLETT